MSISLITAPPAGGKTRYCIDRVNAVREQNLFAPIRVIVPDALALSYWKRALAAASRGRAFIGVKISAFSRLCAELISASDSAPELIPPRLDRLCVKKALETVKPELRYFGTIAEKPGLLSELEKTFRELRQECVTPEQINGEDPRRADTALIYDEYLRILEEHHWTGGGGLTSAAAEVIRSEQGFGTPLVIIDGFDRFTKSRLDLIRALDEHGCEVLITAPKLTDDIRKSLNFRHIALESVKRPRPETQMFETSSQTDEVREVLRELKRRVVHEGIKPADCAIFVPDMDTYRPLLRRAGREMGIPLRFANGDCLTDLAPVEALLRLLRLQPNDYPARELIAVLRSPYFAGCPDPEADSADTGYMREVSDLEQLGRDQLVIDGENEWRKAAEDLKLMCDARVTRIMNSLLNLMKILNPEAGCQSRVMWSAWLKDVIKKIGFYDRLSSESTDSESVVREAFETALNRITVCEEKLEQAPVNYTEFLNEFEEELRRLGVNDRKNIFSAVFVGDVFRAGGARWNLVAVIGLAESSFPRAQSEDLILTKALRRELGLPERTDQTELMRQAVTRADGTLLLTRPRKTDKGEEWPASIYWTNIGDYIPEKPAVKTIAAADIPTPASVAELTFDLLRVNGDVPEKLLPKDQDTIRAEMEKAVRASELLARQSEGQYFPDPAEDALPDYSVYEQTHSCSSIETYHSCPFRWYLQRRLGLEEQGEVEAGMDAKTMGTLKHAILERAFPKGADLDDQDAALRRAGEAMDELLADAPRRYGFRESVLWDYEKVHIRRKMEDTIKAMYKDKKLSSDGWHCAGTEVQFGRGGAAPMFLETENGTLRLGGRIDRVDVNANGTARVIDYKSSVGSFGKASFENGTHIQAAAYADAAELCLGMGSNGGGYYWGINDGKLVDGSDCDWREFFRKFADGISGGNFPAQTADGKCPPYCPVLNWCKKANPEVKYG